jgi:hypothetical protein
MHVQGRRDPHAVHRGHPENCKKQKPAVLRLWTCGVRTMEWKGKDRERVTEFWALNFPDNVRSFFKKS